MDAVRATPDQADRAIDFTGNWKDYLPIAISNALLTIVTLGLYRFWATARQRRYLWSRTRVMDDRLEWTGTGKETFLGFLAVLAILAPFFLFVQFAVPAMILRGQGAAVAVLTTAFYATILYLSGVARLRALRYRLSRSWWRGIRGGSDDRGWAYGGRYVARAVAVGASLGLAAPWAMVRNWNERWSAMHLGSQPVVSAMTAAGLMMRWLLTLAVVAVLIVAMFASFATSLAGGGLPALTLFFVLAAIFSIGAPLLHVAFYALFFRQALAAMTVGGIEFDFRARTRDWLLLLLGNIALAVVTLGFGLSYWGYRNWSFMVRHLEIYGTIDVDALTRSTSTAPSDAEGLADAFDVGAF